MPYLNAKLSTAPSSALTAALAEQLTELTAERLHKQRDLTAVAVEYLPPSQWHIGGRMLGELGLTSFYLDVKVTEGTNTEDEKAAFVAQAYAALEALLGNLHPTSYIVIHEVPGNAWGYQGQTQAARHARNQPPPSIFLSGDYS